MNKFKTLFITTIIALSSWSAVDAQYTEMGIGIGGTTYWGDLNSPSFPKNISYNTGIGLQLSGRYIFHKYFGGRVAFTYGHLRGADRNSELKWQQLRNLSFNSDIIELSLMGEFYIFGFDLEPGSSPFVPYLTAGFSGFRFNPQTNYLGNDIRLQPLGTEGQGGAGFDNKYSLNSFAIPMGAGAKFILNEKINISFDIIARRTFTDYIDDVSKSYVNYDDLRAKNGTLAASLGNRMAEYLGQDEPVQLETGTQRGGQKIADYFFTAFLSVNVKMGNGFRKGKSNKVFCPKF